jgi:hypothetical protein
MKSWLLSTAVAASVILGGSGANAAVVGNLGVDPTSAQGFFSNTVGGGSFSDFYLFQLIGGPEFVTIASATNVFPGGSSSSDFITNFTGEVFRQLGATPDPTTDPGVLGPAGATPCPLQPTTCQGLAGSALLLAGNYYLDISGIGGGTSGYGGNLAVSSVPLPGALALFGGGIAFLFGLFGLRKRQVA